MCLLKACITLFLRKFNQIGILLEHSQCETCGRVHDLGIHLSVNFLVVITCLHGQIDEVKWKRGD